jgi:peptidoglycan/LPS O-acetylase OafA/YrhL
MIGEQYVYAGAYGVQLFFMVSAFTIFLTLDRARVREKHFIQNFFIRRFFRILPMFWVGLALYVFVPGREQATPPIVVTLPDYLLTAVCLHGFHPDSMNSVVPGGWTIAVETSFYFVAPLLFRFIAGWRCALVFMLGALLVSWAAGFGLQYFYERHFLWPEIPATVFDSFAERWFPSQLPVFACGILTYQISRALPAEFLTRRNGWLLLATAALLIQAVISAGKLGFFPMQMEYAAGFLVVFLALRCHPAEFLVNPGTQFLGRISYSGYLLHFALLALAVEISRRCFPDWSTHSTRQFLFLLAATLALTIPAAWLTYKWVESPFIALGARLVKLSESRHQLPKKSGDAT